MKLSENGLSLTWALTILSYFRCFILFLVISVFVVIYDFDSCLLGVDCLPP